MKHKKIIQVIAENYEEEQLLLDKFPGVWWDDRQGRMVFSIPMEQENEVIDLVYKYKKLRSGRKNEK